MERQKEKKEGREGFIQFRVDFTLTKS